MILGILSDTHDRLDRTERAMAALIEAGAEAVVHCGDLTTTAIVLACSALPAYYVWGNNDFDEAELAAAIEVAGGICLGLGGEVDLGGKRVAVTHGHATGTVRRLASADPDYLLYGHTHVVADDRRGATRWINPGALHRAPRWSVAVLDLGADALRIIEVDGEG